jgi:hypothetical protein
MKAFPASGAGGRLGVALLAILVLACALRFWGIDYGLPHIYWTDEYHEVMRAMELGAGGFNLERTGKGGFYLLLFFEYGVYYVFMKLAGAVSSTREFAELFVRDPSAFYLLGRVTAALLGCATVAFVFLVARRAYDTTAALLAALFLAVNLLHVDLSHRVGVDVPMTLFATVAIYFGLAIAAGAGRREYVWAALFAALATTTKLPGIAVLVPLLIAHTYGAWRAPHGLRGWVTSFNAWIAVALFIAVWIATNPGIVLAGDLLSIYADTAGEESAEALEGAVRPNLWLFYGSVVLASMGWPLFVASLAGAVYAAVRRRPADLMLLAYGLANYVAIASTTSENLYFPRYSLPIIVVLCILGARLLADMVASAARWQTPLRIAVIVLFAGWPLVSSARFSHSLTRPDTRTLAKDWFEARVPQGSKVLIEGGKIAASRLTVPLADSPSSLSRRIDYWKTVEPRQARFLQMRQAVHDGGGYELELVRVTTVLPLEHYLGRGVEYFVVRPETFLGSRKADSASATFMRNLRTNADVRLIARFEAADTLRQGPPIEIYQYTAPVTGGSPQ